MKFLANEKPVTPRPSLPVRGAWIEMSKVGIATEKMYVATRAGSVD